MQELFDADEGPCSNSPRHIFNVTASVETPQFASTAARMIASGWRLSGIFRAQSGDWLTVSTGVLSFNGVQATTARVNEISDDVYGNGTRDNWFNPAAFAQPVPGTYGNSERNAYLGMVRRQVDLSLVRAFRFGAAHRIEARIEAFNALNWFRPLPGSDQSPVRNFSDPNFGKYLASDEPRVMQFAVKYSF